MKLPETGGAWKTLEETFKGMSPKKEGSEVRRRRIGLIIGPVLFLLCLLIRFPDPLTIKANLALGIVVWMMFWWLTEPIPMPATSILGIMLFVVLGVMPASNAMNQLGNSNTWLLLGTFVFMGALNKFGFTTRVAFWLLSRKIGRKSPYLMLTVYLFAVAIISSCMSNVGTAMLFVVISTGMINALQVPEEHKIAQAMRLGSAYGAQAGGFATPMGSSSLNFMTIGLITSMTGYSFNTVTWMKLGIPFAIVMTILLALYFRFYFRNMDLPNYQAACDYAEQQLKALGPMKKGEKRALIIALLVMALWLAPALIGMAIGRDHPVYQFLDANLGNAVAACIGAVLTFLIPTGEDDGKEKKYTRIMTWTDASKAIDWGALLLVVCGLVMAQALRAEDVGLLSWVCNGIANALGGMPSVVAVFCILLFTTVLTQFFSNMAAVAVMVPAAYAMGTALGLNTVSLMMTTCMAAQLSFALPVSAPQMAFVYGTGTLPLKACAKCGTIFAIIGVVAATFAGYYLGCVMFPM